MYEAARQRAHDIAEEIVNEIASSADFGEYETGNLRTSYYVDTDTNGDALIKTTAPHWKYVEFGTNEHGDKQPHLRPAVETVRARHT